VKSLDLMFLLFLLFGLATVNSELATRNMQTLQYVNYTWMEIGFTRLDGDDWIRIETSTGGFSDPVVFISVPTSNFYSSSVWAPRIKNIAVKPDGRVTLDAKIYQPNKTDCANPLFSPSVHFSSKVMWLIADRGVYEVDGTLLIIWSGDINRPNVDSTNTNNQIRFQYPDGCPTLRNGICTFPGVVVGAITQIQTLVHDRFLQVRASFVARAFSRFVLTPHDYVDPNYGILLAFEKLAYMGFSGWLSQDAQMGCFLKPEISP
jgi:hypothetical protein